MERFMRLKQYQRLWQLARLRLRSEGDYRAFQSYQAGLILEYLHRHHIKIGGQFLVDLGSSSISGYSQQFAHHGAKVISIDLRMASNTGRFDVRPICANALQIPLRNASVDLVFCASLLEHIPFPSRLISEVERVLKVGGVCYLSFPPFYSPVGGHEYAPYHYLGEKIALRLKKRRHLIPDWVRALYGAPGEPASFATLYPGWGLHKMTIRKARRILAGSKLTQIDVSTRYMRLSFVRWPLLGELLTWHVQFLLTKN
jgi:SAM-dependent methyltransferase